MQMIRTYPWRAVLIAMPLAAVALWLALEPLHDVYVAALGWIYSEQRAFHKSLTQSIGAFADQAGISGAYAIVLGSFLYGVFHAAGPGHGKVILSTYLLSQPEKIGKSVWLAIISALVQGFVAIVLVYGLFYVFGLVSRDMKLAVAWSERLAFALVIAVGLHLVWRAAKGFGWFARQNNAAHHHGATHHHGADHAHGHVHDDHGVCSSCGHAHAPTAEQVNSATDLRSMVGVVLSIGMRPCSGAVLVLIFARFSGIPWAGIMAVLAMSIGTAITVSALAILSVQARNLAMRLAGSSSSSLAGTLSNGIALAGGLVLVVMGYGLLTSTFYAPVRSMGL